MISRVRTRVTYTNVLITLIALFAMSGGAYAASKYVITSTKQISPKVLKSLVGRTGAAGVPGKEGASGKEGVPGKEGAAGKEGAPGKEGKEGQGLKGETGPPGPRGETGAAGPAGPAGKSGTGGGFSKTLPPGDTETGTWTSPLFREEGAAFSAISFPIPLAATLGGSEVHIVTMEEQKKENGKENPTECPGTVEEPKATKGTLCVYEGEVYIEAPQTSAISVNQICPPVANFFKCLQGAAAEGAVLRITFQNGGKIEEEGAVQGTWAVTAP